jgi:NAD(P)H-dependent flavin oxidoreductase YrpB (nitropropane dioxygenase family)
MSADGGNPWLIQGGMGIAVSGWPLARAVSLTGQLGVVSGTAIDTVFARRLQDHGVDESLQLVLDQFPVPAVVDEVLARYAATRREPTTPYLPVPMLTHRNVRRSIDLLVLASFVEVAMAKQGHDGIIGINLLTKVQIPTGPSLFGAILAGVDYVLMGAGVPTHIPGVLEDLAQGRRVELPLSVVGEHETGVSPSLAFDPTRYLPAHSLHRPRFVGIVSSHVLATALAKRSNGPVDGFVVERPSAGGHNAPPRGKLVLDADGNPEYGERDRVDYEVLREMGLPFWIGGGITSPQHVRDAFAEGASGVQVGTMFAYCQESGMEPGLRAEVLEEIRHGSVEVATSTRASTTGYPFKVASVEGTTSEPQVLEARERKCDLGYLREAYVDESGKIGYRCPGEPVDAYIRKGGSIEETVGRQCLCNGLMAACGLGQVRSDGTREPPVVTSGDCINELRSIMTDGTDYSARDVISFLGAWQTVAS